jgi:hypothetical protein
MVYAAIDIHKRIFQAAVLDADTGELVQQRLAATREALGEWAERWQGELEAVALEATTGWRWVWRELSARGFDVRLCDPGQASALRGSKRRPKTDRLDAACSPGFWPRRCSRPVGFRPKTSSAYATVPGCGVRSPRTGCASRSACMRCSRTRGGPAAAVAC